MLHHYGKSSSMVGRLLVAANATISEETRRCEIGILTPGCGIGYRATHTTQDLARADACARTAQHQTIRNEILRLTAQKVKKFFERAEIFAYGGKKQGHGKNRTLAKSVF